MLYIIPIEPIPDRYPIHWYKYLPQFISKHVECEQLEIDMLVPSNNDGAFFNFNFTNKYKAAQLMVLADWIQLGKIKNGDTFFYTDYWNPTVHQLRYMLDINGLVDCKIVGFAHAGDWDPSDILHQRLVNKQWSIATEKSLHFAFDEIYFSTKFARDLYASNVIDDHRLTVTGFPMEYYDDVMPIEHVEKEDIVVFPHRIADEKNVILFRLISQILPQYKFVIAQEVCKTKQEYHTLLFKSRVAFSAALQETGGISMGIEAVRAGCIPLVPLRLSYAEIFADNPYAYSGNVANEVVTDINHPDVVYLAAIIDNAMHASYNITVQQIVQNIYESNRQLFFTGDRLYDCLKGISNAITNNG